MVSAKADHPNCAYQWMNYAASPPVNSQIAEYIGAAPSNLDACAKTSDKKFCTTYHARDEDYAAKIWYWTTPTKQCLDGRDTPCTDYATWTAKWQEIKG
jgi:putative spermidine/putrescine transport system substrate-binding protein